MRTTSTPSRASGAADRSARSARPAVVASVPHAHVYVRHLSPEGGGGPLRLADPDPDDPGRFAQSKWWPPVMLRPEWARTADFDVFHLQFGFDACSPEQLSELVQVLRERGKPLVQTVHDLRNPHHDDPAVHDAQLDVLIPSADALLTLTPGAAAEIRRRWSREALVVPHPHVVDLPTMEGLARQRAAAAAAAAEQPFRVGLHVKSLRASMSPLRILPALVETVRGLPGAVLQVNGHRDVLDDDGARRDDELATYLRCAAAAGDLELHVHDFLPDDELWRYLASLDVSVLPYRFGTHSGWLEACRDLGTTVVAPTCGFYAEQGPVLSYVHEGEQYDAESLRAAVERAYRERPSYGVSVAERRAQRAEVARVHDELYTELVS
ncbi:glycosyltransferase [Nocardioides pacificus]